MANLTWKERIPVYLKVISYVLAVLAAASGILLNGDSWDPPIPLFVDVVVANKSVAWWLIPSLSLLGFGLNLFEQRFGNSQRWVMVKAILEEFRKSVFHDSEVNLDAEPTHAHRVTLFRYVCPTLTLNDWPWAGWMKPVARTGHTTLGGKIPLFRAPKNDPEKAEGIAGASFINNSTILKTNLPELKGNDPLNKIEEYAKQGLVSSRWVQKNFKSCTRRSFIGVPIEVKGRMWGAIVVDSKHRRAFDNSLTDSDEFRSLVYLLSKALEN